jgi:hypothetical protein
LLTYGLKIVTKHYIFYINVLKLCIIGGGSGNAFFNIPIPGGATGISILIQAVDIDSSTESNLVMETL